jgi:porphobilinogen synthase
MRDLVSETQISKQKLIMPVFVDENIKEPKKIDTMPGILRLPLGSLEEYFGRLEDLGIRSVLLFGIPRSKDPMGTAAYDPEGVVQKALHICDESSRLISIADLCLCEYTDHGHCGLIQNGKVENDSTLETYGKIATSYAEAGADMVAPSGMMDGQVAAIRSALDAANYRDTVIMAYSAKYSSYLYGPFRDAAESTPKFSDRKSYQMDFRNSREALREVELDEVEGADIVMVKPGLFYLDVVSQVRRMTKKPLAVYSVSAEYTMIRNAVDLALAQRDIINEAIYAPFRAGADMLITYFAEFYAENF